MCLFGSSGVIPLLGICFPVVYSKNIVPSKRKLCKLSRSASKLLHPSPLDCQRPFSEPPMASSSQHVVSHVFSSHSNPIPLTCSQVADHHPQVIPNSGQH